MYKLLFPKLPTTQYLASAFLTASLASNLISPQLTNIGAVDLVGKAEATSYYKPHISSEVAFAMPDPAIGEQSQITSPLTTGNTSFIATKTPPSKKQIVISKRWVFVTAYSSTVDQTDDSPFITASGSHVRDGIVAANFAYFGTKMRLPTVFGDKIFVVEDRMNSRYPNRVDIWMRTREEAKQFGKKLIPVEIIREI